ncbi:MAG: SCO family protein [Phycisphaerales bacterium]|jgi:protein SCO1/2|nr:SCO family protein [Phycisphaerales bacterium]
MSKSQKILTGTLWGLMVVALLTFIASWTSLRMEETSVAHANPAQVKELPVLFQSPDFSLVNQENKPIKLDNFKGKVWIADFIFTRCGGPCPMMTSHMAGLQKTLNGLPIRFVSFSVDPTNDMPEVLKQYAAKHGADESNWDFLTGPENRSTLAVAAGMKIAAMPAQGESPIIHSVKFVLVDGAGQIRGYYEGTKPDELKKLAEDAATLATEDARP